MESPQRLALRRRNVGQAAIATASSVCYTALNPTFLFGLMCFCLGLMIIWVP